MQGSLGRSWERRREHGETSCRALPPDWGEAGARGQGQGALPDYTSKAMDPFKTGGARKSPSGDTQAAPAAEPSWDGAAQRDALPGHRKGGVGWILGGEGGNPFSLGGGDARPQDMVVASPSVQLRLVLLGAGAGLDVTPCPRGIGVPVRCSACPCPSPGRCGRSCGRM